MRYTTIDEKGAVSFVAHCDFLAILVAACAENPTNLEDLLAHASRYDSRLEDYVTSGLAIFDEHNVEGHYEAIHSALRYCQPHEMPVFRVVDPPTRRASLQPVKAGLVIFNLRARRIVQMQNSFAEIRRRGRLVEHAGVAPRVVRYELPPSWEIVP